MRPPRSHTLQEARRPFKSTLAPRILIKDESLKAGEAQEMQRQDCAACAGTVIKSSSLQPDVCAPPSELQLICGSSESRVLLLRERYGAHFACEARKRPPSSQQVHASRWRRLNLECLPHILQEVPISL